MSSYFVRAVIFVAIWAFVTWFLIGPGPALSLALVSAVTVLIITCPCALVLATPPLITVGTSKGATSGISNGPNRRFRSCSGWRRNR